MTLELKDPPPHWVDGVNEITMPGGPFPSAWRWLLAAATSSPAALRAALFSYAILLEQEGLSLLQAKALGVRRSISLDAPDPKVEKLRLALQDGVPTLIVTEYAATVLYLRDRLPDRSPAWCTRCLAGWRGTLLPRKQVLGWFRKGAPEVAPWVLVARAPVDPADLGRVSTFIQYDKPTLGRTQ